MIADSAPLPIWLTGLDRRRRFVNQAYVKLLGGSYEEALEFDWRSILHPADHDRIVAESIAGEATLKPFTLEARYRVADGSWRWLHSVSQPLFDADGVHLGFEGVAFDLTAMKEAQRELEARERRFSAYVNQTAAGFGEVDATGRFSRVNDRFCEITGYSREELLERTMLSITHPDDVARNVPLFEAAVAHGTPYVHEKRYIRKDGAIIWVNNSVSVITETDGELSGVLAVSIDVTARREAEADLRKAEQRLRLATEGAGIGTWDWNLREGVGTWSSQAQRILGVERGENISLEERMNAVYPPDRPAVTAALGKSLSGSGEFALEYRIQRPDGAIRWVASHGVMERDEAGRYVRALGTLRDVTTRRDAQERLEQLNRTLESKVAERTRERDAMWRLSRDLLLVLDARRRIVAINPIVEEAIGYSSEEVVGQPFERFLHPDDRPLLGQATRRGRRERITDIDARLVTRDGNVRQFVWNATPEAGLAYVNGRDVTEERARQEELFAAQEALRQAQKLEAIGQLTGGVAHDFNNLLSPIIGGLDILRRRGVGGEREHRLIEGALQSAERAKLLVQRLLAFARRQPLQVRAVTLAPLLEELRGLLTSTLGPQIELSILVAPGLDSVMADANQLEMAILNLAVNARDAMPDGGHLRVSAQRVVAASGTAFIELAVSDDGLGMDEETLSRAVEPFFSSKGVGKGTGLGLSMVEGLTAQLGGSLHIDSRPGGGTTVTLCLPVAGGVSAPLAPPLASPGAGGKGCILVVDDEPLVRMGTAELLRDEGYEVDEAESAEAALALGSFDRFACVVTDYLMPGMNGVELAARIQLARPALPILLLSGYADPGAFSALPYLSKPCFGDDLARAVGTLLADKA
ncbi:PAS domain S-box protein [Novosphingobium sp. Gsoil 351]|nr:PAS domain S-box protein [Novosphingobium sp. Gsoil 351]